ncbi:hypothetical protein SEA_TRIBUTE_118 [Streptomyces phage Tribute]|uniref:Uncharacterized protein n=1 Tax=Streptomyces phage Tribute TaxID=2653772 RepID=A0A5Q2WL60_9CAUD|nr:hypothetical protein SEA_TRIBUTE_118 [Streptomyces phage Tribute]
MEHQPTGFARQIMMIGHPAKSMFEVIQVLFANMADLDDDVAIVHLEIKENNGNPFLS